MTRLLLLSSIAILAGCATAAPDAVVKYREQAIAIADRECRKNVNSYEGSWHAELTADSWFVWKGKHAGLHITINARDGSTDGCVVVG